MSDLQLSLLVIGAVVVGAVYLYNWWQERRLHRRLQQAFGDAHEDVLLRAEVQPARAGGRREPQLAPPEDAEGGETADDEPAGMPAAAGFDAVLDYVAEINGSTPIADALIGELSSKIASCGKPARITGFEPRGGAYGDGPAKAADFQEPYLRHLLGFVGITDVVFIRVERIGFGPEARAESIAGARAEIGRATAPALEYAA